MVFKVDENSKKTLAKILREGNTQTYECSFLSCSSPVCRCGAIEVALTAITE